MNSQSKIATPRLLVLILFVLCSCGVLLVKGMLGTSAHAQGEREIEDRIPKHVPIKVKIKSEKEKAFKDLKNEKWHRDFELEVTNTSDKPIYYLELWLIMPEVISPDGNEMGFPLRYGRIEFVHFNTRPLPTDLPIHPRVSYIFKIPQNYQEGWTAEKI